MRWQVKPAIPALACLVLSNDEEVLTDACWAFSYLSDGTNDKIQAVIESGVCPRLIELLWLVTVENVVSGASSHVRRKIFIICSFCFLNYKGLRICLVVSHPSPSVLIPALRTVGNIVTGDDVQTQVSLHSWYLSVNMITRIEFIFLYPFP